MSGLNDAFIIDKNARDLMLARQPEVEDLIYPLYTGADVRRYGLLWDEKYLLYIPHGLDIARYPMVEQHLAAYRERLEQRATQQQWYESQQPQEAYKSLFSSPRSSCQIWLSAAVSISIDWDVPNE